MGNVWIARGHPTRSRNKRLEETRKVIRLEARKLAMMWKQTKTDHQRGVYNKNCRRCYDSHHQSNCRQVVSKTPNSSATNNRNQREIQNSTLVSNTEGSKWCSSFGEHRNRNVDCKDQGEYFTSNCDNYRDKRRSEEIDDCANPVG